MHFHRKSAWFCFESESEFSFVRSSEIIFCPKPRWTLGAKNFAACIYLSLSALLKLSPSRLLYHSRPTYWRVPVSMFSSMVVGTGARDKSSPSSHPFLSCPTHPSRTRCSPGLTLPSPHPLRASDRKGAFTFTSYTGGWWSSGSRRRPSTEKYACKVVGKSFQLFAPLPTFSDWSILPRGGEYSQKNLVGVCGPLPKTLTIFMTKIWDFPSPIYDLTRNSIPFLWQLRPTQLP